MILAHMPKNSSGIYANFPNTTLLKLQVMESFGGNFSNFIHPTIRNILILNIKISNNNYISMSKIAKFQLNGII